MTAAALIKHTRETHQWSQKQLASTIGVTPGFITKIETGQALPGYERCVALARVLNLSLDDLWAQVEAERIETNKQRILTRGASVRGAVRTRGASGGLASAPSQPEALQEIASELAADAELLASYLDLKTAFASPHMRETTRNVLRALAREAKESDRLG